MNKYKHEKVLYLILILILCFCCEQSWKVVKTQSLGSVISTEIVTPDFPKASRTRVVTEKMILVIEGIPPIPLGKEAFLLTYDSSGVFFHRFTYKNSITEYYVCQ